MKATIKNINQENFRVKTFTVTPESPVTFKTGQAMRWQIPGEKGGRLYSVASPGGENRGELQFTIGIRPDGMFTQKVDKLKEGDEIELTGPFGQFFFDEEDRTDVALIAGGTGISVLRAIVRDILEKKIPIKAYLLFSIKTVEDKIYQEELQRLSDENEQFTYDLIVTEKDPSWEGRCGFIDQKVMEQDFGDFHQRFYICGPEPFIACVMQILKNKNVPEERILVDRWTFYDKSLKT